VYWNLPSLTSFTPLKGGPMTDDSLFHNLEHLPPDISLINFYRNRTNI